jgi:hypothetical protein
MARRLSLNEDEIESPRFIIDSEINRQYRKFNATGIQLTVSLLSPSVGDDTNPISHFLASVADLFEYALRECRASEMVGVTIRNIVNVQDKAIGISFRRKDHLPENVTWNVFEKVAQTNARLNALDKLIADVHSVRMPVGFGRVAVKTKGRALSVMAYLKRNIVEVKENNCLAHALIIAIAGVTNDPHYNSHRKGYKILPVVDQLLETTGIDLKDGSGILELMEFQEHFKEYRIVVYGGLNCEDIVFHGQVKSKKRLKFMMASHVIIT